MPTVSQDLAPRGAALEYWFVKLHAGELGFLVDFIIRRATGQAEVRVSLWVRGQGRVARSTATSWRADETVVIGECELGADRSAGAVDDISWDLAYRAEPGRAAPRVPLLGRLHPFDLELISRPCLEISGAVTVAGVRFELRAERGSLTHYWGRRLPERWHWISADAFHPDPEHEAGGDLRVEAVAMVTRLWGRRPLLAAGYLWLRQGAREEMVISPLTGLISVTGALDDYTLVVRRPGRTIRLRCSASSERYNDLGEGIRQTLYGRCGIADRGVIDSTAALEYRVPPGR